MPEYGKAEYWDERYRAADVTFDWYVSFEPLKEILLPLLKPSHRILVVGAGNSRLSAQMYEAGFQNIVNIDISQVCVDQMKNRYAEMDKMQWLCMDGKNLDFQDASFDFVLDKGTTDAVLCGSNSFHNVHLMNKQISRVMKRGATYFVLTYGQPDTRIDHFRRKRLHWTVEHKSVDKPIFHGDASPTSSYHLYIMTKGDEGEGEGDDDDDDDDDDDFYDKFQASTTIA